MMNRKWDFRDQAYANKVALLSSGEFFERKDALEKIARGFAEAGITWRLAFSGSLFLRGVVDDFNDLDILISVQDINKLETTLKKLGIEPISTFQKEVFSSPYYQEAYLGHIHLDLIVDIRVNTFGTTYFYQVKDEEVFMVNLDGNIYVPLVPMEANLILYGMMEGWQARRRYKRDKCYMYLKEKGLKYPCILEDALTNFSLPPQLKEVVESLLYNM